MSYERTRKVKGRRYRCLVRSVRVGSKVRQKFIRHLGPADDSVVTKEYRENIGPVTPIMAEELVKAQRRWPAEWISAAITEAVVNNQLRWSYIERILGRYEREGEISPSRRELSEFLDEVQADRRARRYRKETDG